MSGHNPEVPLPGIPLWGRCKNTTKDINCGIWEHKHKLVFTKTILPHLQWFLKRFEE